METMQGAQAAALADDDGARVGRLFDTLCVAIFIVALFFVPLLIHHGLYGLGLVGGGVALTALAAVALRRRFGRDLAALTLFNIAMVVGIAAAVLRSGGTQNLVLAWLCLPPVVAVMVRGSRAGALWAAVSLVTIVGLSLADAAGARVASTLSATTQDLLNTLLCCWLVVVVGGATAVCERGRQLAHARVLTQNQALAAATTQISELHDLLPICMYCKNVSTGSSAESWERIEAYVARHVDVRFSHGICETCYAHRFPEPAVDGDHGGGQ